MFPHPALLGRGGQDQADVLPRPRGLGVLHVGARAGVLQRLGTLHLLGPATYGISLASAAVESDARKEIEIDRLTISQPQRQRDSRVQRE